MAASTGGIAVSQQHKEVKRMRFYMVIKKNSVAACFDSEWLWQGVYMFKSSLPEHQCSRQPHMKGVRPGKEHALASGRRVHPDRIQTATASSLPEATIGSPPAPVHQHHVHHQAV